MEHKGQKQNFLNTSNSKQINISCLKHSGERVDQNGISERDLLQHDWKISIMLFLNLKHHVSSISGTCQKRSVSHGLKMISNMMML